MGLIRSRRSCFVPVCYAAACSAVTACSIVTYSAEIPHELHNQHPVTRDLWIHHYHPTTERQWIWQLQMLTVGDGRKTFRNWNWLIVGALTAVLGEVGFGARGFGPHINSPINDTAILTQNGGAVGGGVFGCMAIQEPSELVDGDCYFKQERYWLVHGSLLHTILTINRSWLHTTNMKYVSHP